MLLSQQKSRYHSKYHLTAIKLIIAATALISWPQLHAANYDKGQAITEILINAGGGDQPHARQQNRSYGIDYNFYRFTRSKYQQLLIGVSYTHIEADHSDASLSNDLYAISLYPQLNLYLNARHWGQPYFFVRALGPSYLSDNQLGERQQSHNFAFQAQVGAGTYINLGAGRKGSITLSWKHFSNANLFSDNDGFDLPLMLNIGLEF